MITTLAIVLLSAALLLAAWAGVWAGLRRPANAGQIVACLLVEAGLAVQTAIAVIRIVMGHELAEPVTFVAYSFGVLVPLALGIYLARIERTRWGSLAVCFTAVVVAVMTLRLLQLWRTGSFDA